MTGQNKKTILCMGLLLIAGCATLPEAKLPNPTETISHPAATSEPPTKVPEPSPTSEPTATDLPPTETIEPSPTPGSICIPYIPDGDHRQKLEILLPDEGNGPFPVLFVVIGTTLDKTDERLVIEQLDYFSQRGYAVVGVDYRRLPENAYPAQYEDVFCALAWLFTNANEYNMDPERIFVIGDSVGGMFAVMLGTADDYSLYLHGCPYSLPDLGLVRGVIGADVPYDLTLPDSLNFNNIVKGIILPLLGSSLQENPERWAEASPVSHVDGSEPPFLIISTDPSWWMSSSQVESFASLLEANEIEVDIIIFDDAMSHNPGIFFSWFSSDFRTRAFEAIEAFMAGVLNE
jgi:acetyl esterase/lipase